MKWRNQLLALFCLALFAAFGVFYFQHWVVQKPFGIILFIGEGLTPSRLAATRVFAGGSDAPLSLDSMPHVALMTNYSNDFAAPDAAAAATTIATGLKVGNKSVGAQLRTGVAPNLFDLARQAGRATGLITDGKITNVTAAAFYARGSDPAAQSEFARGLAGNLGIDVVVDARLMRKAAEQNDAEHTLAETLELDRAVAVARKYAGETSTVVVCGDVGVGGLHLNGPPFRSDRGIAVLGLNSAGDPWLSWASGPHGTKSYGAAKLTVQQPGPNEPGLVEPSQEPAAFHAPTALETVEDVVVFGIGQNTEVFRGSLDNTAIFKLIRDSL